MKEMLKGFLAFTVLFCGTGVMAQNHSHAGHLDEPAGHREGENVNYCANLQQRQKMFNLNPAFEAQYNADRAQLRAHTDAFIAQQQQSGAERGGPVIIPIVFHIIHVNGAENVSDDQIFDAVEVLNLDYNAMNTDLNNVQSQFQGMQADVGIEFRLATLMPNGQCFKGITRTYSTTSTDGSGGGWTNDQIAAVEDEHGAFPGDEYLNVYLVANADGAAGYTMKPYSTQWGGASMYNGIIILHNYVGRIGTGSVNRSRALTHEIGHWLNLDHPWGGNNNPGDASSCSSDDGIDDTPNTIGHTSCALSANTCSNESNYWGTTDPIDNVENYMDYSYCSKMYTVQQGQAMIAALNSNVGNRDNLITNNNLAATGVLNGGVLCAAEFETPRTVVCVGDSITFDDLSYNAVTSWNWTFTGGSPLNSAMENPTVSWTTPGTYTVSLSVSDGTTTEVETKTNYITVLPATGVPNPIQEGFEAAIPVPNSDWTVENPDGGATWDITSDAAKTGTYSIKMNNHASAAGQTDAFTSTTIDLTGLTGVTVTFQYAYARRTSADNERLRVYVSKDCGQSWSLRKQFTSNAMATGNPQNSPFVPSASQWELGEITNIQSDYLVSNFRIKFEFESDGGNNLYIDDINISGPVGIDDESAVIQNLSIFPNPTDAETNVQFALQQDARVRVSLLDVVGKEIKVIADHNLNAGEHQYQIGTADLSTGIYLVRMVVGDRVVTKRLVVR